MGKPLLRLTAADLTGLAGDMSEAEREIEGIERQLTALAEAAEACWYSDAASEYHDIHRRVVKDAVTVRRTLAFVKEAVELSRDGFSEQDLETLESFRALQVGHDAPPAANPPRSGIADL
ncbi:WXG100 family type VII secretion target [Streptomyces cocklensis]|jgi:uncharacterized protein YukE|uniref:WXG100 family type VII secretion target n=1 Tax=Actinacidiphila cocklensis TaxID=887465 RepID=A0A9W4DQA1_9ACTN|nr:WXG100 family type VII secretion target [Actinacidiphila cocklensis]MDD1060228.1 WXG100 family type VII secretion target [Actinacidiphila cocklensis]WSX76658.1 WXG100 family type VII secretion target [Streptomyces sp. NBC_00899]CAG6394286.1 conserved hypothetical protein [Actinacidiphila cocklensis]